MRLHARPASVCLAVAVTLCLTTSTTRAFFVPSAALRSVPLARGKQAACARCVSPVPSRMSMEDDTPGESNKRRGGHNPFESMRTRASQVFSGIRAPTEQGATEPSTAESIRSRGKQRRARGFVRRSFAAVATAAVVRSSFNPHPALAVGYRPRARSAQEQRMAQERRERRMAQLEAKLRAAEMEMGGAGTATATREQDEGSEGALGEEAVASDGETGTGESLGSGQVGVAGVAGVATAPKRPQKKGLDELSKGMKKEEKILVARKLMDTDPEALDMGNKAKMGNFGSLALGSFAIYNIISCVRGSSDIMGNQRRRVKVETAKFDQQKDEFMNVEGEATVDVDMMKELRDMKEKMAGPGDSYAKDTRKYNPDFAAAHPEEEYDAKIEEALRKSGKKKAEPKTGKTGIVFTADDTPAPAAASEDLFDEGDTDAAETGSDSSASSGEAEAALQAKKDADVKRLQDLFNNSPSEESDSPEDDVEDKGELLP